MENVSAKPTQEQVIAIGVALKRKLKEVFQDLEDREMQMEAMERGLEAQNAMRSVTNAIATGMEDEMDNWEQELRLQRIQTEKQILVEENQAFKSKCQKLFQELRAEEKKVVELENHMGSCQRKLKESEEERQKLQLIADESQSKSWRISEMESTIEELQLLVISSAKLTELEKEIVEEKNINFEITNDAVTRINEYKVLLSRSEAVVKSLLDRNRQIHVDLDLIMIKNIALEHKLNALENLPQLHHAYSMLEKERKQTTELSSLLKEFEEQNKTLFVGLQEAEEVANMNFEKLVEAFNADTEFEKR